MREIGKTKQKIAILLILAIAIVQARDYNFSSYEVMQNKVPQQLRDLQQPSNEQHFNLLQTQDWGNWSDKGYFYYDYYDYTWKKYDPTVYDYSKETYVYFWDSNANRWVYKYFMYRYAYCWSDTSSYCCEYECTSDYFKEDWNSNSWYYDHETYYRWFWYDKTKGHPTGKYLYFYDDRFDHWVYYDPVWSNYAYCFNYEDWNSYSGYYGYYCTELYFGEEVKQGYFYDPSYYTWFKFDPAKWDADGYIKYYWDTYWELWVYYNPFDQYSHCWEDGDLLDYTDGWNCTGYFFNERQAYYYDPYYEKWYKYDEDRWDAEGYIKWYWDEINNNWVYYDPFQQYAWCYDDAGNMWDCPRQYFKPESWFWIEEAQEWFKYDNDVWQPKDTTLIYWDSGREIYVYYDPFFQYAECWNYGDYNGSWDCSLDYFSDQPSYYFDEELYEWVLFQEEGQAPPQDSALFFWVESARLYVYWDPSRNTYECYPKGGEYYECYDEAKSYFTEVFGQKDIYQSWWFNDDTLNWVKYTPPYEKPPQGAVAYFWDYGEQIYVYLDDDHQYAACNDLQGQTWVCTRDYLQVCNI